MFKSLFLITLVLSSISASLAKVELQWLSIGGLSLDDGETKILIDPTFTRPTWRHWFLNGEFKSDPESLKLYAGPDLTERVAGIFVTHTHFDHVVDVPEIAKLSKAPIFGDENMEAIVKAYQDSSLKVLPLIEGQAVSVGKFRITPINRQHSKLMGIINFLPGKMSGFDFNFYDFKEGVTRLFLIEHSEGTILFDIGNTPQLAGIQKFRPDLKSVDVLVQGYYENDSQGMIDGYVTSLKPSLFIPIHYDNFFKPFKPEEIQQSLFLNLQAMVEAFEKKRPGVEVRVPKFKEKIEVLPRKKEGSQSSPH